MAAKIVKLAQSTDPTIDQVFEEFLAEQRERSVAAPAHPSFHQMRIGETH